jgi:phage gpG-like protein
MVDNAAVREDCTGVLDAASSGLSGSAAAGEARAVGSKNPVLRRIALRVRKRSRFNVALGEAPAFINSRQKHRAADGNVAAQSSSHVQQVKNTTPCVQCTACSGC